MKTVKRVFDIITTLLVVFAVIAAVSLLGVRLFGIQVYAVLSGSMEPTIRTGSLIYVRDVDYRGLEKDDIITFRLDETTVATHRIVAAEVDKADPAVIRYRTKGDANTAEDDILVSYKDVLGSPVLTIPAMGYVANYLQNPPGSYLTITASAAIALFVFLSDYFKHGMPRKNSDV